MYICMIYMYLTKQVNRLILVGLQTKTSDLAKLYTMDKIGTLSCQMVKKRIHKFHNRFWNAYSYLKRRMMEFSKYLRTVILGRRSRRPLATPPGMGYIRRTESVGCQSGSNHSHPMVSVMSLLLNLLFLFCMHLFRLGYLTVCLINMLYGFVALNLIRLYNCWHIYMRLPTYENSRDEKPTDPFCHVSLTLASFPSLLFPFFFSLSLSPLLFLYFISFSVISHEPGIIGISVLSDGLRHLFLVFFEDSDSGIVGLSVSDRYLSYPATLLSLSIPQPSLAFLEDSDPGIIGISVSYRYLSYPATLLSLSLPQPSLAFLEDSDPGIVGISVSDRNLSYPVTLFSPIFTSSFSCFLGGFRPWYRWYFHIR